MVVRFFFVLVVIAVGTPTIAGAQPPALKQSDSQSSIFRSALTDEQVERRREILQLLRAGIDFSRERGEWPQELSALNVVGVPALVYLGPPAKLDDLERHLLGELKSVLPVCHETLAARADGVWVGYADGHLELVRDATALQSALSQSESARPLIQKRFELRMTAVAAAPETE